MCTERPQDLQGIASKSYLFFITLNFIWLKCRTGLQLRNSKYSLRPKLSEMMQHSHSCSVYDYNLKRCQGYRASVSYNMEHLSTELTVICCSFPLFQQTKLRAIALGIKIEDLSQDQKEPCRCVSWYVKSCHLED